MNLVNMKREDEGACAPCPPEAYPYGLRICLNDDDCEKLGIKGAITAGSVLAVVANVVVVRCSESLEMDGDDTGTDIALDLQITEMAVSAPTKTVSAKALYSQSDMGD